MSETPKRPILSLKNPPKPKPAPAKPSKWKCKPCGATVQLTGEEDPAGDVRCPGCNARLGLAGDFNSQPPKTEGLRARPIV